MASPAVDGSGRYAEAVDGSGQYAEAISPPMSPPTRLASPMTENMDHSSPIPVDSQTHDGFTPSNEKKYHPGGPAYYSAPEVVEQNPPQYGHYGGPPPGSPPPQQAYASLNGKEEPIAQNAEIQPQAEEPKIMGMRRRVFFITLAVVGLIILAVALGAGLGVTLGKDKDKDNASSSDASVVDPFCKDHPELCIGGALDSKYYSEKGAFNGSGIALAGESWNSGQRRIFTLYFQHHSGDIRYMQYRTDKQWDGGEKAQTVAQDAKNGTAISAVSYSLNGTQFFHVFYISKDNTIRQKTRTNATDSNGFYEDGKLNDLNLKALESPTVGLQACWKGDYYGGDDPSANSTLSKDDVRGINLWYASDETTFEQYSWNNGKDEWTRENPWKGKNGHAGVGCYSWGTGSFSYTIMVNDQNNAEIWWIDTNSTTPSTKEHPINSWTNSTKGGIPGVYPSTSFGFTTYLYMQMADKSVNAYDIEWAAENTTAKGDPITIRDLGGPVYGLGGTHLTLTAYNETVKDENGTATKSLWDSLYVFYQTEGDDITAFSRPILGGEWTDGKLQIPEN